MSRVLPDSTGNATAVAEAYRILRSSLKFASSEQPIRSVLVVDVDRSDVSGVAEQLAASFARAGDRCVHVRTSGTANGEPGLAELIDGVADVGTVARPAGLPNLARLSPGARLDPDMLASEPFDAALASLVAEFPFVVLSCAPLPATAAALAIAPRVDATVLVVTSGRTRRPRAIEARDALRRVGANIAGVVLVETKRRWFW